MLECVLQQHTTCTQGKGKERRNDNPQQQQQQSTKTTRFPLGVAKDKESATEELSSM